MGQSKRTLRWGHYAVMLGLVTLASIGCTPATIWHLASGDRKKPAEYPLPAKGEKKTVTVAILPTAAPTLGVDFAGVDREITTILARRLVEESKDDRRPIQVIEQSKVDKFLSSNPNWKVMSPGLIGKQLGADYLLDINVDSITLFGSQYGREAYSGRAQIKVLVYDTDTPDSPMREYVHTSSAPAKDANGSSPSQYRQWFVERISVELAFRHVAHATEHELGPLK